MRRVRAWCDICRAEEPDLQCTGDGCRKRFHRDCLGNTNQLFADDDYDNYVCPSCRDDEENDAFCYKCRKAGENITLLLCDGCPRSAHLNCLGLDDIPPEDAWLCPICDPKSAAKKSAAGREGTTLHSKGGGRAKLGNVDICYVCQKGGKLLACDHCDQSFHPKCIDPESLELMAEDSKWECPICQGDDPLKNMGHKRMSKQERCQMSQAMQKTVEREARRCRLNRDLFLYQSRAAIQPFVSPEVLRRLKKAAGVAETRHAAVKRKALKKPPAKPASRLKRLRKVSTNSSSSSDEDGAECGGSQEEEDDDDSGKEGEASDGRPKAEGEEEGGSSESDKLLKVAEKVSRQKGESILKPGVRLKPYQRHGVSWLLDAFNNKAGAILADEMGLGKTIQTLAFLSALKAQGITGPHLIVVPLSTVGNWAREIRRFVPHLTNTKICGSRAERNHAMSDAVAADGLYDIVITTYETTVTEEWFFTDQFAWQTVVLDEAHRIKNESARIRHSLDRVRCNMRVLLTGTPLQNNVKELFTLVNFLFPDILKGSAALEQAFSAPAASTGTPGPAETTKRQPGTKTSGRITSSSAVEAAKDTGDLTLSFDEERVVAITSLLSKLMLRRTKDLVVQLPKKLERDVWLPLSPEASNWYKKLLDVSNLATDVGGSIRKLLGAVIKMRVCCCHPKGLVSKAKQLESLEDSLKPLGDPANTTAVPEAAAALKKRQGWSHLIASSKLTFLDKLLCLLHLENMEWCESYRSEFLSHRNNQVREAIQTRKDALSKLGYVFPSENDEMASSNNNATKSSKSKKTSSKEKAATSTNETSTATDDVKSAAVGSPSAKKTNSDNSAAAALEDDSPSRLSSVMSSAQSASGGFDLELAAKSTSPKNGGGEVSASGEAASDASEEISRLLNELSILSGGAGTDVLENLNPYPARLPPSSNAFSTSFRRYLFPAEGMVERNSKSKQHGRSPRKAARVKGGALTSPASTAVKEEADTKSGRDEKSEGSKADVGNAVQDENELGPLDSVESFVAASIKPVAHKVLIFTQFQLCLDELELYCRWRGWRYMRLDGSTNKMIRELDIREFNSQDSTHLIYLISTRAGGLGINLVTANHVVMYDEDWNPFVDLQAVDRAHRIGQVRDVHVWKLITEWTVEERMAVRRQQKIKLDKLLIQSNVANLEASQSGLDADENRMTVPDEKLSSDEIRRLITYGRTALMSTEFSEGVEMLSLEDLIARKRRDLRNVESEVQSGLEGLLAQDGSVASSPSSASVGGGSIDGDLDASSTDFDRQKQQRPNHRRHRQDSISVAEVVRSEIGEDDAPGRASDLEDDEDSIGIDLGAGADGSVNSKDGDSSSTLALDDELVLVGERVAWRPKRQRKKPNPIYTPVGWLDKPKIEKKINHEKKCFQCGNGGVVAPPPPASKDRKPTPSSAAASKSSSASASGPTESADGTADSDLLAPCMRCPKVYHSQSCLGFDKPPPKSWMCPWHECCLCSRRAGACGGLLIHCAECPTAFCFDCFPPEYRRYVPPPEFFEALKRRGWDVTPQKLVTFLCSKCKALKEQYRRRHLTRQQLEEEMRDRKEKEEKAKQEARKNQEESKAERTAVKEQRQREVDERRLFAENKRKIDEVDRNLEVALRNAFEALYPKKFLEVIEIKRDQVSGAKQRVGVKSGASEKKDVKQTGEEESVKAEGSGEGGGVDADDKDGSAAEATATSADQTINSNSHAQSCNSPKKESEGMLTRGAAAKRKPVFVSSIRRPSEALRLCDNCRLPCHDTLKCPFPAESIRLPVDSTSLAAGDGNVKKSKKKGATSKTATAVTKPAEEAENTAAEAGTGVKQTTTGLATPSVDPSPDIQIVFSPESQTPALQSFARSPSRDAESDNEPPSDRSINIVMEDEGEDGSRLSKKRNFSVDSSRLGTDKADVNMSDGADGDVAEKSKEEDAKQQTAPDGSTSEERPSDKAVSTTVAAVTPTILEGEGPTATLTSATSGDPKGAISSTGDAAQIAGGGAGTTKGNTASGKMRSVCPVCRSFVKIHSRKHCDQLTAEDTAEYKTRRENTQKFIKIMEEEAERGGIEAPAKAAQLWDSIGFNAAALSERALDVSRRQLNVNADRLIETLLEKTGLGQCVPVGAKLKPSESVSSVPNKAGGDLVQQNSNIVSNGNPSKQKTAISEPSSGGGHINASITKFLPSKHDSHHSMLDPRHHSRHLQKAGKSYQGPMSGGGGSAVDQYEADRQTIGWGNISSRQQEQTNGVGCLAPDSTYVEDIDSSPSAATSLSMPVVAAPSAGGKKRKRVAMVPSSASTGPGEYTQLVFPSGGGPGTASGGSDGHQALTNSGGRQSLLMVGGTDGSVAIPPAAKKHRKKSRPLFEHSSGRGTGMHQFGVQPNLIGTYGSGPDSVGMGDAGSSTASLYNSGGTLNGVNINMGNHPIDPRQTLLHQQQSAAALGLHQNINSSHSNSRKHHHHHHHRKQNGSSETISSQISNSADDSMMMHLDQARLASHMPQHSSDLSTVSPGAYPRGSPSLYRPQHLSANTPNSASHYLPDPMMGFPPYVSQSHAGKNPNTPPFTCSSAPAPQYIGSTMGSMIPQASANNAHHLLSTASSHNNSNSLLMSLPHMSQHLRLQQTINNSTNNNNNNNNNSNNNILGTSQQQLNSLHHSSSPWISPASGAVGGGGHLIYDSNGNPTTAIAMGHHSSGSGNPLPYPQLHHTTTYHHHLHPLQMPSSSTGGGGVLLSPTLGSQGQPSYGGGGTYVSSAPPALMSQQTTSHRSPILCSTTSSGGARSLGGSSNVSPHLIPQSPGGSHLGLPPSNTQQQISTGQNQSANAGLRPSGEFDFQAPADGDSNKINQSISKKA